MFHQIVNVPRDKVILARETEISHFESVEVRAESGRRRIDCIGIKASIAISGRLMSRVSIRSVISYLKTVEFTHDFDLLIVDERLHKLIKL